MSIMSPASRLLPAQHRSSEISAGQWKITELDDVAILALSTDDHIIAMVPTTNLPHAHADAQFLAAAPARTRELTTQNAELRGALEQADRQLGLALGDVARAAGIAESTPGHDDLDYICEVVAGLRRVRQTVGPAAHPELGPVERTPRVSCTGTVRSGGEAGLEESS